MVEEIANRLKMLGSFALRILSSALQCMLLQHAAVSFSFSTPILLGELFS